MFGRLAAYRWPTSLLLYALFSISGSYAGTHTVCSSGCDFVTIQAAIDAAGTGDLIQISESFHTELGIVIDKDLEIAGIGVPTPVVQAALFPGTASARVFQVLVNVDAVIRDLEIRHGVDDQGGAIFNEGSLEVLRVNLHNNEATAQGGAISSTGPLLVNDSLLSTNQAGLHGGGVFCSAPCTLSVDLSVIEANATFGGFGGGVFSGADNASITDSEIRGNSVFGGSGGGIWTAGSMNMINNLVADNSSSGPGGGVMSSGDLTLIDSEFNGNQAGGSSMSGGGGGLGFKNAARSLTVQTSEFIDNSSSYRGGAIYFEGTNLFFAQSTFTSNDADAGGGLYLKAALGTALVERSLFQDNSAATSGGGIGVGLLTALELTNSTVSGNVAGTGGGGIEVRNSGELSLSSVTITDNDADPDGLGGVNGGGIWIDSAPGTFVEIRNSILAGNRDGGNFPLNRANDCAGALSSDGFVHVGTLGLDGLEPACRVSGFPVVVGGDPGLGALADNGGPTLTHALLSASLNVNGGDPVGCRDANGIVLERDQRDAERGSLCDRGAFEFGGALGIFVDGFESGGTGAWSQTTP